jgi:hypothetical protein
MFKFLIYKQNVLVNFNKYDLSQYSLLRQITNNAQWSIKIETDSDFLSVKRLKFNGDISVQGSDYNALIALEGSQLQYCVQIQEKRAGVWTEKWKGYFSYFDYKVDRDRCQLKFTPSPFDIYTPIYDQMDLERNVLTPDTGEDIFMNVYAWPFETSVRTYASMMVGTASYFENPVLPGYKYYLYSRSAIFLYYDIDNNHWWQVTDTFRRDVGYSNSDTVGPTADPDWVLDPALDPPGEYSPGVYKWVRWYLDNTCTTYQHTTFLLNEYYTLIETYDSIGLKGCIKLKTIIEYFATFFNLSYESHLLNDSPCPMGGRTLNLTMIQQISNMAGKAQSATKGLMKLKDLLIWIRDTIEGYWYIDSLGDFRIEHRKYFDLGLSYTYSVPVIEMDLTTYESTKNLNRYEWSKPSLVRFEKLEIPYSNFTDWIDASIEYPQLSITGNDTRTVTVGWGTDLISMKDAEDLPTQGWTLLDVELRWAGGIGTHWIANTVGAITGTTIPNARFSTANLLRDFWGWGRLLPTGNVNGALTTFGSYDRLRKQVELTVPLCITVDFNGYFKTGLGNGLLESGEIDCKGNFKLNLKYE